MGRQGAALPPHPEFAIFLTNKGQRRAARNRAPSAGHAALGGGGRSSPIFSHKYTAFPRSLQGFSSKLSPISPRKKAPPRPGAAHGSGEEGQRPGQPLRQRYVSDGQKHGGQHIPAPSKRALMGAPLNFIRAGVNPARIKCFAWQSILRRRRRPASRRVPVGNMLTASPQTVLRSIAPAVCKR